MAVIDPSEIEELVAAALARGEGGDDAGRVAALDELYEVLEQELDRSDPEAGPTPDS
jgi:hypothetical protein